ncbi:MAG: hypothetical protein ACI4ET_08985 [Bilifractor sp.]
MRSEFTKKGYEKAERLKAEAISAQTFSDRMEHSGSIRIQKDSAEGQLLLSALKSFREQRVSEAEDIKLALDCGDEYGNLRSHSEKEILDGCLSLMQEVVEDVQRNLLASDIDIHEPKKDENGCYLDDPDGTEWWQHWFSSNISYQKIVNRLFLWGTTHSGGTSTYAKCRELGVEPSHTDWIEFNPEITEDNYFEN